MSTMAKKRDYYEVLGVPKTASPKDIASAYRKLAIKYHPDSNPGDKDAVEKFKEAPKPTRSQRPREAGAYDQYGHAGVEDGHTQFNDVQDIFEAFGDIFGGGGGGGGSIFGDLFGGRRQRRSRRGADIRVDVSLELEEAARGVSKTIEFPRSEICGKCNGTGNRAGRSANRAAGARGRGQVVQQAGILRVQTTCPTCGGRGRSLRILATSAAVMATRPAKCGSMSRFRAASTTACACGSPAKANRVPTAASRATATASFRCAAIACSSATERT